MARCRFQRLCRLLIVCLGLGAAASAEAQFGALERMVSPGPLISGHADAEAECTNCHARFSREQQRDLCLDCHEDVAEDLNTGTGFHSLSPDVAGATCASCHTDHEGRDADITGLDRDDFDHDLTDFPLRDSHVDVVCDDCHEAGQTFHAAETECVSCHADDDRHMGNLGDVCSDCHVSTEWADAHYDHETESGYALLGAHAEIACVSCHIDEQYVDTPDVCVDCHIDDDEHMGRNGPECQDCHNSVDWAQTLFDHFDRSGFALTGAHADLECESCHEGNVFDQTKTSECVSCHLEDDSHDGINGTVCDDCHRTTEWLDVTFDHAVDTDFPLLGAHADVECADCHVEPIADALPATECIGCHADDDPHEGQLGDDCASCHVEIDWNESVRFDHDFASFPLLGKHDQVVCEDCHASFAFHDASDQCVDCHIEDDVHEATLGPECANCHTPLDWTLWQFDHDTQTDFPLDGAHRGLACSGCHRRPAVDGQVAALGATCIDCHRADDVHDGEFGEDCSTCHTSESFDELRAIP